MEDSGWRMVYLRSLMKKIILILWAAVTPLLAAETDYALRDGDTVAFLGDSITAARGYTKIVEHYTVMRYSERKVRFFNAGQGGDTASGAVGRLERDVFSKGATVVTVTFGINDISWGMKANAETRQKYLDGIRTIITQCREKNVRPIICSPAITAEEPEKAERGFLAAMTDDGLALARSLGAQTIDLQRGMRAIQRRVLASNATESDKTKHSSLHVSDGVHLSDLGQLAMAYAMIQGLGVAGPVSEASINAAEARVTDQTDCTISGLECREGNISFIRLDKGLPLNLGVLSGLNHRFVPMPDLGRYHLRVSGLPEGKYDITADGRNLGQQSAAALAKGVDCTGITANGWEPGGLWNAQSDAVKELIDARDKLWAGGVIRDKFMTPHPDLGPLTAESRVLDDQLTALIRHTAKPVPYHIVVSKALPSVPAGEKPRQSSLSK